jgi:hypothetical protein
MDNLNDQASLVYEKPFAVRGVKDEAVTYSFKLSIMTEGAIGAGLRILLKRASSNNLIQ